jgi:hypothetical protein
MSNQEIYVSEYEIAAKQGWRITTFNQYLQSSEDFKKFPNVEFTANKVKYYSIAKTDKFFANLSNKKAKRVREKS